MPNPPRELAHYRTIWISDFHLGTKGSKADYLLEFLRHTESDYLYLVGDIIDGWQLKRGWYWPQAHNDVLQKVLRKARKGSQVIYLPGNHDEFARQYLGFQFGDILVKNELVHVTADGRRLLVLHGDQFDGVVKYSRWLAVLGARAYDVSIVFNTWIAAIRRALGLPYWSLSAYLKQRVKNAVNYISEFEHAVARHARAADCAGIVCGHIHKAEIREIEGVQYLNDGDWVESCTALVEHKDGRLELIRWVAW